MVKYFLQIHIFHEGIKTHTNCCRRGSSCSNLYVSGSSRRTKKVEVVVLHAFPKATIDGIDANKFGGLLSAPFTNKTTVAISLITPNYGSTPATSYSIPFSGNAIALHTLSGEQFATAYSVSYQLGTPTSGNTSTSK